MANGRFVRCRAPTALRPVKCCAPKRRAILRPRPQRACEIVHTHAAQDANGTDSTSGDCPHGRRNMNGEARLACKVGVSRLGTSPEIMPEVVHPRTAKAPTAIVTGASGRSCYA